MGGQRYAPAASTTGRSRYPFCRRLVGPRVGLDGRENLASTGIRSMDRPARSESLYRLSYPGPCTKHCTQICFQLIPQCIAFDVARCPGHESRASSGSYSVRGHVRRLTQLVSRKWWIILVVGKEAKMTTKTLYLEELSPFCCHFSFLTNEPRLLNYFLSMGTSRTPRAERRGSRIKGGLLYFNSRFVVTMCAKLSWRTYP